MSTPEWVATTIVIACAVAGLGWWLGGQSAKDRIVELKDRLKLAGHQYNDINTRISDLKTQVEIREEQISELLGNPASERVEELARDNAKIKNALTNLATSTDHLGNTLSAVRLIRSTRRRRFFSR
jgi:chromosome segregation ATPase